MTSISLSLAEFIVFLLGGCALLFGMLALAEIGNVLKRIAKALELSNSLRVATFKGYTGGQIDEIVNATKKGESS